MVDSKNFAQRCSFSKYLINIDFKTKTYFLYVRSFNNQNPWNVNSIIYIHFIFQYTWHLDSKISLPFPFGKVN